MNNITSTEEHFKNIPRKHIGSGGLFLNDINEILLVKPTYKEDWEIPGGVVEINESPQETFQREIKEELGLDLKPKQLLVFDFNPKRGIHGDSIMLVFFGGVFDKKLISSIKLPKEELSEYKFVNIKEAKRLVSDTKARRLVKALEAYNRKECLCLIDGYETL